jgi:hypothetical protein
LHPGRRSDSHQLTHARFDGVATKRSAGTPTCSTSSLRQTVNVMGGTSTDETTITATP